MRRDLSRRALWSWVLVCGCFGTETGNPLSEEVVTTDPNVAALSASDDAPVVDGVWVSFESIGSLQGATCDHLGRSVPGDAGDLLAGLSLRLPNASAEPSCGVHLGLAPAPALAGAPASFAGALGLVTGVRADGVRFEVRAAGDHGTDARSAGAFDLGARHVLSFDIARALAGVDLSGAPEADGVVRVSGPVVDAAFLQSFALFRDLDGDGAIDDEERALGPAADTHR